MSFINKIIHVTKALKNTKKLLNRFRNLQFFKSQDNGLQ